MIKKALSNDKAFLVPRVGIEPTLPKELDFESSASTSSATEANPCDRASKVVNYFFLVLNFTSFMSEIYF